MISDISLKKENSPNVYIYGNPTISNGVVSGFSETNWVCAHAPRIFGTYIIKFTMPSSIQSVDQEIFHLQRLVAINVSANTANVNAYSWRLTGTQQAGNTTIIPNATMGQTYWIKLVYLSASNRTAYYSTNGTSWTQVALDGDDLANTTEDYDFYFGNNSRSGIGCKHVFFRGSIDLNECKILDTSGNIVWEGMGNQENYLLGTDAQDGIWISPSENTINSNFTIAAAGFKSFSLATWIPEDNYDYECLFEAWGATGTTSGNGVDMRLIAGTQTAANWTVPNSRAFWCRTRSSSSQQGAGECILTLPANVARSITVYNASGSGTSGSCALYLKKYRRLGRNGFYTSKISNINNQGVSQQIGGTTFNGNVIYSPITLINGVSTAKGTYKSYSMSSLIPYDGYNYSIYGRVHGYTIATSGKTIIVRIGTTTDDSINLGVLRTITRTASTRTIGQNFYWEADGTRNLQIKNDGNDSATLNVVVLWCRRMGAFEPTNNKYIERVNIPSDTEQPNGDIFGSPTIINNGDLTTTTNSGLEIPFLLSGDFTVTACFTTPVSFDFENYDDEVVFHCDKNCAIEIQKNSNTTGRLGFYNWQTKTTVYGHDSGELANNTKYWTKTIVSGSSRACYISPDGENYALVYHWSDTTARGLYKLTWGDYSNVYNRTRTDLAERFSGQIHLKDCYISSGAESYIEHALYEWRGKGPNKRYTLSSSPSVGDQVFDEDGVILIGIYVTVYDEGTNSIQITGDSTSYKYQDVSSDTVIQFTPPSENSIIWKGMEYSQNKPIAGDFLDGPYVHKRVTVYSGATLAASTVNTSYSVTNYLPDSDNYYEVTFESAANTGATSGNNCNLWLERNESYGCYTAGGFLSYVNTRTKSSQCHAGCGKIICKQRASDNKIMFQINNTSTATGSCSFVLTSYKRIGTNI
jgi:hypothetical protein